jgi:hypothetical protein
MSRRKVCSNSIVLRAYACLHPAGRSLPAASTSASRAGLQEHLPCRAALVLVVYKVA